MVVLSMENSTIELKIKICEQHDSTRTYKYIE